MAKRNNLAGLERFRRVCREHGLRVTPQRVMIYQELVNCDDHPSCDRIFEAVKKTFPDISFDTVYRSLSAFHEIGLVDLVQGYGAAMRFDPNTESHHHFRCRRCGRITDFENKDFDNLKAPAAIAKEYEVLKLQVTVEGYCDKCRNKRKG